MKTCAMCEFILTDKELDAGLCPNCGSYVTANPRETAIRAVGLEIVEKLERAGLGFYQVNVFDATMKGLKEEAGKWWRIGKHHLLLLDIKKPTYEQILDGGMAGSATFDDPPKGWTKLQLAFWGLGYLYGESVQYSNVAGTLRAYLSIIGKTMGRDLKPTEYYRFADSEEEND